MTPTPVPPEPVPQPHRRRRRLGCTAALILWFLLLLTPCALIYFAVQQELTIPLGGAPGQELRVWLVMEPRTRGLGISTGHVAQQTDTGLCVQTATNYVLWQGRPLNTVYCECYSRTNPAGVWSYGRSIQGACPPTP
jgi:hypothetical protein